MEDRELLREYIQSRSDAAFAELVRRHVGLVYSTALRLVGEEQMARDVTQTTFIRLASNAPSVREGNALPGWLYRITCRAAADTLRSELRRRDREAEAMKLAEPETTTTSAWAAMVPLLDEAMRGLGRIEQDAVVLRFFEDKSLGEVGRALGLTEEAARKRVNRALEKLRVHFARQGVALSSALITTTLAAHSVQAVPAGFAAALPSLSLAGSTATAKGVSAFLCHCFMTKTTKIALVAVLALTAGMAPIVINHMKATNRDRKDLPGTPFRELVGREVAFTTAAPTPQGFQAWTFYWNAPAMARGTKTEMVVMTPEGREVYRARISEHAPAEPIQSDFWPAIRWGHPSVFYGKPIKVVISSPDAVQTWDPKGRYYFAFFRTEQDQRERRSMSVVGVTVESK